MPWSGGRVQGDRAGLDDAVEFRATVQGKVKDGSGVAAGLEAPEFADFGGFDAGLGCSRGRGMSDGRPAWRR